MRTTDDLPSPDSSEAIISSKSAPSPSRLIVMISLFSSNTEIPVPSNITRDGSFWDLKRKKTEEAILAQVVWVSGQSRTGFTESGQLRCRRTILSVSGVR